jgi:hypothetical protein
MTRRRSRKRSRTRARGKGRPALKPCPPGKERNPATNRCRKIQTVSTPKKPKKPQLKPCPVGKERNPATNRCRKIQTVSKPKAKPTSLPKPKPKPKPKPTYVVKDVLHNLVTINGHGTFNPTKIKVPEGFQVLVPHRNGLEADYTTPDAGKDRLYEERLYGDGHLNYREGWKLYLPGDDINDLIVKVFHDGAKCRTIDDSHELQKPLIEACRIGVSARYKKSCPLYCTRPTNGTFDYLDYKGSHKLKIKACKKYPLSQLFQSLPKQLQAIPSDLRKDITPKPNEPIILIPFTCNAKSGSKMNGFDLSNHTSLNTIYHDLIKHRQ